MEADLIVNAAGPRAAEVARLAGVEDLPVRPRKRFVYQIETPAKLPGCPLVIDPSGVYVQPEGEGPEKLVVYACVGEGTDPAVLIRELDRRIAEEINPLFRIHDLVLIDELPRTATNKLMRRAHVLAEAGQLVVIATHDLTLAAQADRLLILGSDGFVADGPPREILRDEAPWAQVGLQVPDWVVSG